MITQYETGKCLLENIKSMTETNNAIYYKLRKLFLAQPEAPIFNDLNARVSDSIKVVAKVTDIQVSTIEWFVYENEFGKNEMTVANMQDGEETDRMEIKTIDDFLNFEGVGK